MRNILSRGLMAAVMAGLLLVFFAGALYSEDKPRVLVMGFDGMDPKIADKLMKEGKLPNLERLRQKGSFCNLQTSIPPQSPVAWSNFITGKNPGGHGIFDFIARDPETYLPYLSTTVTDDAAKTIKIGKYIIPLSKAEVVLLRKGKSFWEILEEHDIPAVTLRLPSNFPPSGHSSRGLSGMGTPDMLGTYGTFSFFTTKPYVVSQETGGRVFVVDNFDNKIETTILGPPNTFLEGSPDTEIPLTVYLDPDYPACKIQVQDNELILSEKEWSDWVTLKIDMMPLVSAQGIVRFYLKAVRPDFELYMSPIQIDPRAPAMPISTPPGYSKELAEAIGPFYTQGIAEETWALNEGRLNEDEYLTQSEFVLQQTRDMLDYELDRFDWGLLYCYFSTADCLQHMFWRFRDPDHPMYDEQLAEKYRGTIEYYYTRLDSILGHAVGRVGPETTVIALSDHGFTTFRRNFHLNTWLYWNGYMSLRDDFREESDEFFENVDWSGTKAYALGINGLYINEIGREGQGVVAPGAEKEHIIDEIRQKLLAVRDPETGEQIIAEVYKTSDWYSGEAVDEAPDMIIGYNKGYRGSWETALGKVTRALITDNAKRWSGDHCMAREVVPGVLFTSKRVTYNTPALYDLAPTILGEFGIEKEPDMVGTDLFNRDMVQR
ncbi:MAG: alkaline phosphatase family protein [bacterium]|jgi:predicted AlkP superfamily phosphohydrolase/phosphomutase